MADCLLSLFDHPELLGHAVGFNDMTELHGQWIKKMVFSSRDYTLQAHRGSYKSNGLRPIADKVHQAGISPLRVTDPVAE